MECEFFGVTGALLFMSEFILCYGISCSCYREQEPGNDVEIFCTIEDFEKVTSSLLFWKLALYTWRYVVVYDQWS